MATMNHSPASNTHAPAPVPVPSGYPAQPRPAESHVAADSLLAAVLTRRWRALLGCLLVSALAAGWAATRFSIIRTTTSGELMIQPLPVTPQAAVYQTPRPLTLAGMLTSHDNMLRLSQLHGLRDTPQELAESFVVEATRDSSILTIQLRWHDGQQAIDMLNDLMKIFMEQVVAGRRALLASYREHAQRDLAAAESELESALRALGQLRAARDEYLASEGTANSAVARAVSGLTQTENALDLAQRRRSALQLQLAALRDRVQSLQQQLRDQLIAARLHQLALHKSLFAPEHPQRSWIVELEKRLHEFSGQNADLDYPSWRAAFLRQGADLLGPLDEATQAANGELESQWAREQGAIDQLQLQLAPMDQEIQTLEARLNTYRQRVDEVAGSGASSGSSIDEVQARYSDANENRLLIQQQLSAIRSLEECRLAELAVLTPASWETTEISYGKPKVFAVVLMGCFVVLCLPVFVHEHLRPAGHPAELLARSTGLPVVSRSALGSQRRPRGPHREQPAESIRLLALRIQQGVDRPGAVVLFSAWSHDRANLRLLSQLGECLAQRQQQVLIVEASSQAGNRSGTAPQTHSTHTVPSCTRTDDDDEVNGSTTHDCHQLAAVATVREQRNGERQHVSRETSAKKNGVTLADFLSRPGIDVDSLIQPTRFSGVDWIAAGTQAFPRESLGSRLLVDLFEQCRQRYTLILVAGPSIDQRADLEMLAAHADAIFFIAPNTVYSSTLYPETIRDLVEMGAPVAGIIG